MLQAISDWITKLSHAGEGEEKFSVADPRLSVAAILVHIVAIDGVVTGDEKRRLREVLSAHYSLSPEETESLVEEATQRDDEAVDLYAFTSVLKRELDEDGRREVVELMWEMVYADGEVSEFEDNIVWRVAELIGVTARDRVTIRKNIEARRDANR
ncbi:TerB family tellurite resistance protein [Acuticoccus kandeliae]|uniref:tellurite resistance TerB family protein n=1 Tax=Acuticoccus kandeliae TaxID=2073160 RepID=UPI000D3E69E3|nr:TerB family tellurite resistance protein [Acuticoccus kandeliae]